jgi:uncharacterized protein YdeI (YjbR/CyaY-like superfamily)
MKNKILALAIMFLVFLISSCIPQSAEEAQVDFCQALVAYGDSLQSLTSVSASTTVDEIEENREAVAGARQDVQDAAGDLREAKLREAEKAWDDLQDAINDIPGNATMGEAAAAIRGGAFLLSTELEQIRNISCGRR